LVGDEKFTLYVEHIAFGFQVTVIKILSLSGQYDLENNFALFVLCSKDDSCQYTYIPACLFQDEHGQSMLHFAAARSHGRNALFQMLQEADINIGYRDELYRTARDVAIQANIPENIQDIDKWVLYMGARGKEKKKEGLLKLLFLCPLVTNCISYFIMSMKLVFTLRVMNR
jgi:hypothetical protein